VEEGREGGVEKVEEEARCPRRGLAEGEQQRARERRREGGKNKGMR
jgi:hypothetical protein